MDDRMAKGFNDAKNGTVRELNDTYNTAVSIHKFRRDSLVAADITIVFVQ